MNNLLSKKKLSVAQKVHENSYGIESFNLSHRTFYLLYKTSHAATQHRQMVPQGLLQSFPRVPWSANIVEVFGYVYFRRIHYLSRLHHCQLWVSNFKHTSAPFQFQTIAGSRNNIYASLDGRWEWSTAVWSIEILWEAWDYCWTDPHCVDGRSMPT